jgi:hypothetical protein
MVGLVLLGLAVALGVFIQYQARDPRPPEDVPRALAIPAVYATMGLLAIIGALQRRPAIAAAAVLLVVDAAIALLVMTEGRCWQATGSPADPTYTVIPCGGQAVLVGGGQTFASGFDSGVLTTGGGLVEAVLLLGALTLAALTGRTPTETGVLPSIDQAPPL